MTRGSFRTASGQAVPAVTAEEMAAVDRVAVEEVGLQLLQMMENAGRTLARHVRRVREDHEVVVVAGGGGNGGGGLACARHLINRDVPVHLLLDRPPGEFSGATATQQHILDEVDVPTLTDSEELDAPNGGRLVVDALVGYGLSGPLRPPAAEMLEGTTESADLTVSLDVPSGVDATTGERPGPAVSPDRTVTLALPKTGLDAVDGTLFLADIAIPTTVYDRLSIDYREPFGSRDWVELEA